MANTTAPARPDLQLADAEASAANARHMLTLANQAEQAASGQYDLARAKDPASTATAHARHAWSQALADYCDARVAHATAQDQLRAVHRQPAAPLEGAVRTIAQAVRRAENPNPKEYETRA